MFLFLFYFILFLQINVVRIIKLNPFKIIIIINTCIIHLSPQKCKKIGPLHDFVNTLVCNYPLINLYHHQMEEFDNLKMEYAFMKTKLLIYQQRNQVKHQALHKEQVGQIIQESFESYQKDKEFYQQRLKAYWKVMPHLVMPPSDFSMM